MIFKIDNEKFLDLEEVLKITGWSFKDYYYELMKGHFPKSRDKKVVVKLERTKRLWSKADIDAFLKERRKRHRLW